MLREIYKGENQMMKDMRKFIEDSLNKEKLKIKLNTMNLFNLHN